MTLWTDRPERRPHPAGTRGPLAGRSRGAHAPTADSNGGRCVAVTADNRIEYVHLIADYRLNQQIAKQTKALKGALNETAELPQSPAPHHHRHHR